MARPRKEPEVEEKDQQTNRTTLLKIGGVLAGIVVIVIIIIILAQGGGLNSIVVGNIERDAEGISFPIMATRGMGDYTGDVNIEIYFEDMEDPVYEGKASIDNGDGTHEVDYTDFVWGNGDYYIYAKGNGHENYQIMRIESLVEEVVPEFKGKNSDLDMMEPDFTVDVTIGYKFGSNRVVPRSEDPQTYRFVGTITAPDDSTFDLDSNDYPSNRLKITRSIDHLQAGTYTLAGTVTNEFCHPNSPFKEVLVTDQNSFSYDSRPFAVLGDDINLNLTGGSVNANFDASDSWDDSSIEQYHWYITGEGLDVDEITTGPTFSYSFTTPGTYVVSISLMDDNDQTSIQNADAASMIVTVQ